LIAIPLYVRERVVLMSASCGLFGRVVANAKNVRTAVQSCLGISYKDPSASIEFLGFRSPFRIVIPPARAHLSGNRLRDCIDQEMKSVNIGAGTV
jgi:hypothetical protein